MLKLRNEFMSIFVKCTLFTNILILLSLLFCSNLLADLSDPQNWMSSGDNIYYYYNGGKVGIGTSSPSSILDTRGTTNDGISLGNFSQMGTGRAYSVYRGTPFATRPVVSLSQTNADANSQATLVVQQAEAEEVAIGVNTDGSDTFNFIVNGSGFVGIGTSSPSSILDTRGTTNDGTSLGNFSQMGTGRAYSVYRGTPFATRPVVSLSQANADANSQATLVVQQAEAEEVAIGVNTDGSDTFNFVVNGSGNVGVRTEDPGSALDVNGVVGVNELNINTGSNGFIHHTDGDNLLLLSGGSATNSGSNIILYGGSHSAEASETLFRSGGTESMRIDSSGNVGIGTTTPQEKLSVDGTVLAKEIKVSINSADWSDYVFEETYQLPSLDTVESYIQEYKHLPDLPSAKEIEEDGLSVSTMLAKQMQKIEELTLYLIEMKNDNIEMKLENGELRERLSALEKK